MSFLRADAGFAERVTDLLAYLRGNGLLLSALDSELLARWDKLEVPFEVVARGMRKAAEAACWDARPGEPAIRTLRACRHEVEAEIESHFARCVGRPASEIL